MLNKKKTLGDDQERDLLMKTHVSQFFERFIFVICNSLYNIQKKTSNQDLTLFTEPLKVNFKVRKQT